jgi:hypothetical protein
VLQNVILLWGFLQSGMIELLDYCSSLQFHRSDSEQRRMLCE